MREPAFLKRNQAKWKEIESKLSELDAMTPDDQANIFLEITDDLAYSKTYYPNSSTTKYINSLAVKLHQSIYKNKKERGSRIFDFWKYEIPRIFYQQRKMLWLSLAVFCLSMFIGALSTIMDESFVRLILGDQYVNMTLDNIDMGDPLAVYKGSKEGTMFIQITLNNVKVSFITFILGVIGSLGTLWALISNGIMVGSFLSFFYIKGLFMKGISGVMIHGTLELSAIVLAGAAGFTMGNSILFPGTYSRIESFRRGASKGMKMAVGIVPLFIVAGFLEGFVTRHYQFNWILNFCIILLSAIFIIYYFILYPIKLNKNDRKNEIKTSS